ncbi:hypothetical protein HKCCE3408_05660 [Rhodobacterales bacterium HKCCE3408]|nr:hypothetical protein [Rhodobacterales bacterium HKCCE3408]
MFTTVGKSVAWGLLLWGVVFVFLGIIGVSDAETDTERASSQVLFGGAILAVAFSFILGVLCDISEHLRETT